MEMLFIILIWVVLTLIFTRIFYIIGFDMLAYILTIRRLKGFGNYRYQNILFHGPLTSEKTRTVPFPTPHAMVSSCIYNVRDKPLRIKVVIPDSVYFSVTFFARNQDCYFTLNDVEAKQKYGQNVEIVLKSHKSKYNAKGNEIIVTAPRFSKLGLILVRIVIMNPEDKEESNRIHKIQKMTIAEVINNI